MTAPKPDLDPPPVLPMRPGSDDCCQSGCDPCVFELYAEAMERYRRELKEWEERSPGRKATHSAQHAAERT